MAQSGSILMTVLRPLVSLVCILAKGYLWVRRLYLCCLFKVGVYLRESSRERDGYRTTEYGLVLHNAEAIQAHERKGTAEVFFCLAE